MEKAIELEKDKVAYTLRLSKRARRLRLSVAVGGAVTVTAPEAMRQNRIETFIRKHSHWVLHKIKYFKQFSPPVYPLWISGKRNRKKHFAEHKGKALALVEQRLEHFNQFYTFAWNKIGIRNQTSRWGSCSRKGNLNFNYKIAFLPAHLADYIIVHELCHLGELNHSKKFWSLVEKTLPHYRELRKELRISSLGLR